jgi:hypothetical protein
MIPNRESIPEFLNEQSLTGYGAEIGVYQGEFSIYFLQSWYGQKLYLIDSWRQFSNTRDISNPDRNGQLCNLAQTFLTIYPFCNKTCLIRELSVAAVILFPDNFFDFVYIDAGHDYKSVTDDLTIWTPKVKTNGYVFGHDYLDLSYEQTNLADFEVKRAVDDFVKLHDYKLQIINDPFPTFYFRK